MCFLEELTKQIADWIRGGEEESKLDFRADLDESEATRQPGTCDWIFGHPTFEAWYNANSNAVAWYTAPPGSGKTILSAAVAHYLESQDRQFVYFRYSYDDDTRRKPLSALRSIALQLRTIKGRLPDQVIGHYRKEANHHAYRLQNTKTALDVVEAFVKQCARIHIIIDGLDECCDTSKALDLFRTMLRFDTYGVTKWFFTSRDEPDILATMNAAGAMSIRPEKGIVMNDIAKYLDTQGQTREAGECAACVRYWTVASEENFLYSKLMFDILCGDGVTCSDEIHEELQKFPPGLKGCYMRCIENITRRSAREQELAR
jgi:NACHT domain